MEKKMVYYSALHWAKKAEKHAEHVEEIKKELDMSGLDLTAYAKDAKVVHNTGDETIDGVKTFNSNVNFNKTVSFVKNTTNTQDTYQDINYIRDNALETNNIPYDKTYYTNALMDKNNKFVTYIQNTHAADGTSSILINARTKNANGDNVTGSIGVEATKNGNVYAIAPTPVATSSMDSKQISTVGWVNDPSASTNVVHRSGGETIEGKKIFKSSQGALYVRFTGADSEVLPTSTVQNKGIRFEDKNGVSIGNIVNRIYTNGAITEELEVCRKINGAYKYGGLGVIMSNTGVISTSAPTPPTGDNSTQIATTEWVNDPTKSTNVLHRTGDESFSGTKTMLGQRFIFGATNLGSFKEIEARSEKGSTRLGVLRFQNGSDGVTRSVEMSVVDNTNSNRGGLKVGIDSGGAPYATAPTPKADSNYNAIATTEWVVKHQPAITNLSATSGNISLSINNIYTMSVSGTTTFSLATPSNKSVFNQIKLMMKVTGTPTINWGTTYFFNKIEPRIEAGSYDVYFDYDNLLSAWVCGVIPKGTKK